MIMILERSRPQGQHRLHVKRVCDMVHQPVHVISSSGVEQVLVPLQSHKEVDRFGLLGQVPAGGEQGVWYNHQQAVS